MNHIFINRTEMIQDEERLNYRTGTYAAIEMAIQRLKRSEVTSICDVVKALRDQRVGAIQNDQVNVTYISSIHCSIYRICIISAQLTITILSMICSLPKSDVTIMIVKQLTL